MDSTIKAIFFDIDHTLYSHSAKRIPASTWDALKALREKGVKLFIASGRQYKEMFILDEDWDFFDGYVTLNGTVVLDAEGRMLASFPLDEAARASAVRLFESRTVPLIVVEKDRLYANMYDENVYLAQKRISTPLPEIQDLGDEPIYQLIFYATREHEAGIMDLLDGCVANRWNEYAFDVIRSDAGKDKGILAALDHYGLNGDECMVFGDGDNDISMLSAFRNSVAMGNGTEGARAAASFVTKDIDEGGVPYALERFGLL